MAQRVGAQVGAGSILGGTAHPFGQGSRYWGSPSGWAHPDHSNPHPASPDHRPESALYWSVPLPGQRKR